MESEITGFVPAYDPIVKALRLVLHEYYGCRQTSIKGIQEQEARKVVIIILSAALCEACINTWLALKLDQESFALIEKASTIEKWKAAPRLIIKDYGFPVGTSIHEDLTVLFRCRSTIMHAKSEVYGGKTSSHKNNHTSLDKLSRAQMKRIVDVTDRIHFSVPVHELVLGHG